MDKIKYVSIDSSLRNTGIAIGTIDNDIVLVNSIYLVETEKSKIKTVRASSDTIYRCRKTYEFVNKIVQEQKPDVIFVETPSGSQNADAMKSYGSTCMLIASINPPPIEVAPKEVKVAAVGNKTASKKNMIDWASGIYPGINWIKKKDKIILKNEHMADAIAIVYAGIQTKEFQQIKNHIN